MGANLLNDQMVFNLLVSIAGFLGLFVFNSILRRLQRLEDDTRSLRDTMPREYVHKDDYRSDIKEIKEILKQISDRLESKTDKNLHHGPHLTQRY